MDNQDIRATWHYHNGTKHPNGELMNPAHRFGPEQQPLLFKIYTDLPAIPLPLERSASIPALEAITSGGRPTSEEPAISLAKVTRLLYYSAGITKTLQYPPPWGAIPFRAAACTGALYHIELYLVCEDIPDLEAGVYHFDPQELALRQLRRGDYRQVLIAASGREPNVANAPVTLLLTDVVWRNAVKYQAREYRHAFWDSGTILANTLAMAAAQRLSASVVLGFVDEQVSQLLDLDPERELALALVPVGSTASPASPLALPVEPLNLEIQPYSRRELSFPAINAMHAASSLPEANAVTAWRESPPQRELSALGGALIPLRPLKDGELPSDPIEEVIVRRGSTRRFARQSISFEQLSTILDRALEGFQTDFSGAGQESLNQAYLIVNAVDDLKPGAYVYQRERQALEELKAGDFRTAAGQLGLYQDLAADASLDIFFLADLRPILASLGNRGYRAAQLQASLAAGRVYLAAYALGLGASGLTFFDDAVTSFFSPHAGGKSVMFLIAVGKRRKRSS